MPIEFLSTGTEPVPKAIRCNEPAENQKVAFSKYATGELPNTPLRLIHSWNIHYAHGQACGVMNHLEVRKEDLLGSDFILLFSRSKPLLTRRECTRCQRLLR